MSPSKRNITVGMGALLAVAVAAAFAVRGCGAPLDVAQHDMTQMPAADPTAAVPPGQGPQPTPEQSARKGQIYFHRDLSILKIIPGEGVITRLAELAEKGLVQYQVQSARLSPDATRMAYGNAVTRPVGNGLFSSFPPEAILVRDVATSQPGEKVASREGSEIHDFFWSPESRQLAFTSWDSEKGIRNWVVDVATKEVHELKLPIRHAADGKEFALAVAAWAPDGDWFAAFDDGLLYLVEMKNKTGPVWSWSGRKRLTKDPHPILGGTCRFSPDGRKVLFVVVDEGIRMSLWTVEAGASEERMNPRQAITAAARKWTVEAGGSEERILVASGKYTDLSACWSPDGRRIAFSGALLDSTGKRAGQSGIYIIDADGSNVKPETVMEEFHPPEVIRLRLVDWR
jgi:hypothetical protein